MGMGMGMGMSTTVVSSISAPLESVQWTPPVGFSTIGITSGKVIPLKTPPLGCKYSTGDDHVENSREIQAKKTFTFYNSFHVPRNAAMHILIAGNLLLILIAINLHWVVVFQIWKP